MEAVSEAVEKSIRIRAPARKIFDYISDPNHLSVIWANVVRVHDVQMLSHGRHRYRWQYKLCEVRFEGESECVALSVPDRMTEKWRGGIQGQVDWVLISHNGDTLVTLRLEYAFPTPLTQKHTCEDVNASQARDIESALENLKRVMEG